MSDERLSEISIWRSRIANAEKRREQRQKITRRIEAAIRGELRPSEENWSRDNWWVGIRKTFASIRSLLPSLLYTQAQASVTPTRPIRTIAGRAFPKDVSWELARIKELALNHVWREAQGNKHARVGIVAAFLDIGVLKAGYLADFEDDKTRGVFALDEETGDMLIGADGLPELEQGDYLRNDDGEIVYDGDLPALNPGLLREGFFVDYVHYDNLLYDPDGGNVFESSHRWVVEEIMRPLTEVRDDPRYDKRARHAVVATNTAGDRPGKENEPLTDEALGKLSPEARAAEIDASRVRLFDIYDFVNRRILTIPAAGGRERRRDTKGKYISARTGNDVVLRDVELPAYMEHGPFRFLRFNEEPGQWQPLPDGDAMAQVELEYNLTRSQQMEHRKNALPRWMQTVGGGFAEAEGGDEELRKFTKGGAYTVTTVNKEGGVFSAPVPQLDASHFAATNQIERDFREVAGAPGEFSGVASADTATQASILAGQADVRNNDRRDNLVQTWIAETMRLLLQTMQANMEGSIFLRITGPDLAIVKELGLSDSDFLEINRELLQGEFDVNVAVGSTQPKNSASRLRLLVDIGTMISQNPAIGFMPTYLRRLFEAADIQDENLMNEAMAMAQAATQGPPTENQPGTTQELSSVVGNGAASRQSGQSTGSPIN